jgi:GDP-mannose 6-dehydrogenase
MKISVMGLGYVGAVSAACLADDGHEVIGVDVNPFKVALIKLGRAPVIEEGLEQAIARNVAAGALTATSDGRSAVRETEISIVCVGTPSRSNGNLDDHYVKHVCLEIGEAVRSAGKKHTVVLRSTMLPGTIRGVVIPALELGFGGPIDGAIGVAINPEFLRECTALDDYRHPPKTVIGADDPAVADLVEQIYRNVPAPIFRTPIEVAELVKYVDNVWHALKVTFANEVGAICKQVEIDSHVLMDIFVKDTKLNISSYYMRPGFAFGGSCLPKDVRALTYKARSLDLRLPILENILASNAIQIEKAVELVRSCNSRKVGILGLSFKANTDDLRESPVVEMAERLIGKGYDVRIFDTNVSLSRLVGANKQYLDAMIPHIDTLLLDDMEDVLRHGETIVVGHSTPQFHAIPKRLRSDQTLIDLVRLPTRSECTGHYVGFSW